MSADRPRLLRDRRSRRWAILAGFTIVALFFATQKAIGRLAHGAAVPWLRVFGGELYYWYLLAAFLPIVLRLARRLRIGRANWRRTLPLHAAAALAIGVAHSVLYYAALAGIAAGSGERTTTDLAITVARQLPTATLTVFWKYGVILGLFYAFDYHEKYRERELRAVRLEARLADARLKALEMQLHPHFLFNTLHSVAMLNLEDSDDANRMLARLSELLRMALENAGEQEVRLAEEVDFVRRYLEIEQVRFRDRLSVSFDVDAALLDAYVPNLLLQPLVENAVRHGISRRKGAGTIGVHASTDDDRLVVEVHDDAGGLPPGWRFDLYAGVGLSNTRERLAALYDDRAGLALRDNADGGVTAVVWMPLRVDIPAEEPAVRAPPSATVPVEPSAGPARATEPRRTNRRIRTDPDAGDGR